MQPTKAFKISALLSSLILASLFLLYRGGAFSKEEPTMPATLQQIKPDSSSQKQPDSFAKPQPALTTLPSSKSIVPLVLDQTPRLTVRLNDSLPKAAPVLSPTRFSSSKSGIIADSAVLKTLHITQH